VAGRVRDRTRRGAAPSDSLDAPPVDPMAVQDAYRVARARRRAREQHERATRWAGIRFWFVTLVLLAAAVFLAVTFWREVQDLFGL
jgi:anti-sigma-K factor RskA